MIQNRVWSGDNWFRIWSLEWTVAGRSFGLRFVRIGRRSRTVQVGNDQNGALVEFDSGSPG